MLRHPAITLCCGLIVLAACSDPPAPPAPDPDPGGGAATTEAPAPASAVRLAFTDVTEAAGIRLRNISGDHVAKLAIPENLGQGVALFDHDGDGDLDLFLPNGDVFEGQKARGPTRCALYRNDGNFRFTDVTEEAGLAFEAWVHGAYALDFDGDGDRDLYLTVFLGPNRFFRNEGEGRFTDQTATFGGGDPGPSTAAAFFDADGDGDLDLYVGNYVDYDPKNPPNGGNPCGYKGLNVSCGPRGTPKAEDRFYRNDAGRLVEATKEHGFAVPAAYSLGVVAADADGDGDIDLFVANDSMANYHFINEGNGHFHESGAMLETAFSHAGRDQAGMGIDCADVNNDGMLDLYVTHFAEDYNTLYLHTLTSDQRTLYEDVTDYVGLKAPTYTKLSWGTGLLDLDHDGDRDIVVVSGHVYPQVDEVDIATSYRQTNQIFLNRGVEEGRPFYDEWQPGAGDGFLIAQSSRGLAWGDLDQDGDLDLVINELDELPTVLRNDSEGLGAWIAFALEGVGGQREAIGAEVIVIDATGNRQVDQRTYGESYFSTCDPRLHFGLGTTTDPVAVTVRWPSGKETRHEGLAPGRYYTLSERSGDATPWPPR